MHARSHSGLQAPQTPSPKEARYPRHPVSCSKHTQSAHRQLRRQARSADRSGALRQPRTEEHPPQLNGSQAQATTGTNSPVQPSPPAATPVSDPRLPDPGRWKAPAVARGDPKGRVHMAGSSAEAKTMARKMGSAGSKKLGGRGCERVGMGFKIWI